MLTESVVIAVAVVSFVERDNNGKLARCVQTSPVVCIARQSAPSSSRVWRTHDSGLSVICPGSRSRQDVTLPLSSPQISPGLRERVESSSPRNSQGRKKFRDWHLKFASNLCQENKNVKLNSVLFSTLNIFIFLMMKIEVNVSREHQDDILFADTKQTFDSQSSSWDFYSMNT